VNLATAVALRFGRPRPRRSCLSAHDVENQRLCLRFCGGRIANQLDAFDLAGGDSTERIDHAGLRDRARAIDQHIAAGRALSAHTRIAFVEHKSRCAPDHIERGLW